MADETIETTEVALNTEVNPYSENSWAEQPVNVETKENTEAAPVVKKAEEEKVIDTSDFLKTNLGYDNWDLAKADISELRKLKETATKEEQKFIVSQYWVDLNHEFDINATPD